MRRFGRHALRALYGLTLFLCVVCVGLIPLSFFRIPWDVVTHEQSSQVLQIVTGSIVLNDQRGPGMVEFFQLTNQTPHTWTWGLDSVTNMKRIWEAVRRPRLEKLSAMPTKTGLVERRIAIIPLWLPAAIFSLPKTLPALTRRLRRTHPVGACANCGYDLRATPDRCPECGVAPAATVVASH